MAHVHSAYIVAASCMLSIDAERLPIYSPSLATKVGFVPIVSYYVPGSQELSRAVLESISDAKAVILRNHGLVCIAGKVEELRIVVEEVEENARIYVLSSGKAQPLTSEQISEVRARYVGKMSGT